MFNSSVPFFLLAVKHEADNAFHVKTYFYRIKTFAGSYIVNVEEYTEDVFIVKFYPAWLKRHANKFQIIVDRGAMQLVVGSVMRIMEHHFEMNKKVSFGFIASPSIIGTFTENKGNNQRFRIYREIMLAFFGTKTFEHSENKGNSAYLMINRCKDVAALVPDLTSKFSYLYPGLLELEFTGLV